MIAVEVKNLFKSYGEIRAVDDFSFSANDGEILAVVGPDGAGKTSTFRAACGLIKFDSGEIHISNFDVTREYDKIKPLLGYMPQIFSLYPDLTVEENFDFYAGLFGLEHGELDDKKELLYGFSGLGPFHNRRASALSGGMKQKLALSCALIHDPRVLILDEPTTGVDPLSRKQFWDILRNLRSRGTAILVSTPYMDEVSLADRAIFIYGGRKLAEGTPEQLTQKFKGTVYRVDVTLTSLQMEEMNKIAGIFSRRFGSSLHIYIPESRKIDDYDDELKKVGITSDMTNLIKPELEDAFIQLMSK